MRRRTGLTLALLHSLSGECFAKDEATLPTAYINPDVPTGTPVFGNYDGRYRPQVHFSPPKHFMNDPNGLFRRQWHMALILPVQPDCKCWRPSALGTRDVTRHLPWVHQPIALFPPKKDTFVFSGSAVVDVNNTGFFPDQTNGVVAMYVSAPQVSPLT